MFHLFKQLVVFRLHPGKERIVHGHLIGFALNKEGFKTVTQITNVHQTGQTRAPFQGMQQAFHLVQVFLIVAFGQPRINGIVDALGEFFCFFQEDLQNARQ